MSGKTETGGTSSAVPDNSCPGCGVPVPCGIAAGGTTCWCMSQPGGSKSLPVPSSGRCYCQECLEKLAAARA